MSDERFVYYEHKGADYILDTPNTELDFIEMLGDALETEEIVDKLNEQQATINELKEENKELREEWEFSFRTEMAHHRVAEKELQEKIREKQATISDLKEENEKLKQKIQRWKTLYEIKDKEVTARVKRLNEICNQYKHTITFDKDIDPNDAVNILCDRILQTEVEM